MKDRALQSATFAMVLLVASAPASLQRVATGQEETTEIVVSNGSDLVNGDTSTVSGLKADPGPDGISLREAIEATNNDPATYTIRFDPALVGATIPLELGLPPLIGGGVSIDGDIDGDAEPDVTLASLASADMPLEGFVISSSHNRLLSLALDGFAPGVTLHPYWPHWLPDAVGPPTGQTFTGNTVSGMVMTDVGDYGVSLGSAVAPGCETPEEQRCDLHNTLMDTTITGNTIEAGIAGVWAAVYQSADRIVDTVVTDNEIVITGGGTGQAAIAFQGAGHSLDTHISDVLIARNSIEGPADIGIDVSAGVNRAQRSTLTGVRILDNRIHLVRGDDPEVFCCQGIIVQAGSEAPFFTRDYLPHRYVDGNVARDVLIRGNVVTGTLEWGLQINAGFGNGGRRNLVKDVRIRDNAVRTTLPRLGVYVSPGDGHPYRDRYAKDNRILGLVIDGNRLRIATGPGARFAGGGTGASGIALVGGGSFGRENVVRNVRITRNSIRTAYVGIRVIGGRGGTAVRNRVICVPMLGNRIAGKGEKPLVRANVDGATRNAVRLGHC